MSLTFPCDNAPRGLQVNWWFPESLFYIYMPEQSHAELEQRLMRDPMRQFVDGQTLLKLLFPQECRPCLRWLRERQRRREVPFVRAGRRVFFVPERVQAILLEKWGVTAKADRRPLT